MILSGSLEILDNARYISFSDIPVLDGGVTVLVTGWVLFVLFVMGVVTTVGVVGSPKRKYLISWMNPA